MLLKKDIYWGAIRNIVVFDGQAAPGELTPKLLDLMYQVFLGNGGNNVTNIYVDKKPEFEYHQELNVISMKEFEDYFIKEFEGTYAPGDNNLVVIIDEPARILEDIISKESKDKRKRYNTEYILLGSY